ncbi:MAG: TMEM175 family protein [Methyloceanibacter sp.]
MTDGVYAFAMTLLVVNIELPEGFEPKSNQEFLTRLSGLSDTFIAYLITFFVLVSFWFGRARTDDEPEMASAAYAWTVLIHLLSITFLPFSMLAVGRYDVAAAVWIYGANMIVLSLSALAISWAAERDSGRARQPSGRIELTILIASAILSMITSLFAPDYAMLLYLLNLASPLAARAVYQR